MSTEQETTHTKLPKELLQRRISQLEIGECAWTVPGAMEVDEELRCWVNENVNIYPFCEGPYGNLPGVTVSIKKMENGYIIDITRCREPYWTPTPLEWLAEIPLGKVVELITPS